MKLRPVQLVCLALLLSTLSLVDSSALVPGQYEMQTSYLRALLLTDYANPLVALNRQKAAVAATSVHLVATRDRIACSLSAADSRVIRSVWTMRPPSAQHAAVQTFSSFGRLLA